MLEVKFDENNLRNIENTLETMPKQLPGAIARAINRSLAMTKTEQLRRTAAIYTIKKGKLAESIKEYKASAGNLTGKIYSTGKVIGLDHFKLNPKTRSKGKKMIKVSVKKGGMKSLPNAFIAYNDGRLGAFKRKTSSAFPIERLKGPSAPQMLGEMSILDYLQGFFEEKFNMRFEHEIGRLIK
nr:MAG TPA: minor tail protein Z [Caudoviricetes sp.]